MKHLNRAKNDQDSRKLLISQRCRKDCVFSLYCCPLSSVQLAEDVQKSCDAQSVVVTMAWLLSNPSIRESIVLPAVELPVDVESRIGLGYDSTSGDYKILHIHEDLGDCKLPDEILALKGGSWRRIDKHPRGINSR
ncbi:hypothetical protein BC332_29322 [Capsicum chinense]|nr:hypothetical protein BC332_29322 [Capsicum chinense]